MIIPDEALESAANIVRTAAWGHISPEEAVRKILEVAAPHLRAAWEADAALEAKAEAAHAEWVNGE